MDNDLNYNVKVTYDDGTDRLVYATNLHNEQLDYWQGWKCSAGEESIYIYDSKVYGGECCNSYLGILGGEWKVLDSQTTCLLERCSGCTTD